MSGNEWKPIAEAPKNGTRILACWYADVGADFGVVWWAEDDFNWLENGDEVREPTHWQPLPEPPSPHHERGA